MFGKQEFSQVFQIGDIIESGAGPSRKNAARLRIVAMEDEFFRYESIRSRNKKIWRMPYSYVGLLLDEYEQLDPNSIQKTVNVVRKKASLSFDSTTENYAYSFTKAYKERDLFLLPEELPIPGFHFIRDNGLEHLEGKRALVMVERIERDKKARLACIAHFGIFCNVCNFNFEKTYGAVGKDFIRVHHHKKQLSDSLGEHKVDPIHDLIPLCPNCHAMAHRETPMVSLKELRKRIKVAKAKEIKHIHITNA